MIIKGSSRGQSAADVNRLARHLLAVENESVAVVELRGVAADRLSDVLAEMRALSLATRTRRPLYHASLSVTPEESRRMTARQWVEAADELELRLGLVGHQRALVQHSKKGRTHLHVVWNRCDAVTLKVAHDSHTYAKHEACARALEQKWRLRQVTGAHTRAPGIARPVAAATHRCWQAQERTGVSVANVSAILRHCWDASTDGRDFAAAVHLAGLRLARGRRGVVAIDAAGTPHSLGRRLGLKAAEVHRRLADLDPASLPSVDDTKAAPARPSPGRTSMPKTTTIAAVHRRRRPGQPEQPPEPVSPDYWKALGYETEEVGGMVFVTLSPGVRLEDRGDSLRLHRDGPPTPEETALMVAAGKARGWEGIRFSGGSPEWQRAARLEALKLGYPLDAISLECEDNKPPVAAVLPMPDHIRRRLNPPKPPKEDTPAPMPTPALPAPEPSAPGYRP